jgi:hypothetical protein
MKKQLEKAMLTTTIAQNAVSVKTLENSTISDSRQKRYSLEQKAEYINYLAQRSQDESKANLTWYAERQGVSRTTLYQLYQEFQEHFGAGSPGPKKQTAATSDAAAEQDGGQRLVITSLRVIRSILQAAVSPMSNDDIQKQLAVDFDLKMSRRKIKKIIAYYSKRAAEILRSLGLEELIKDMAIDEIFCASDVILTGVDLPSMALVISKIAANRDHKTWHEALSLFTNLETVSSDRAKGIIKGVEMCLGVLHQFDLFHFKRDAHKQLRRLEGVAYGKIDLEYRAQVKLTYTTGTVYVERQAAYQQCCQEATVAIACFDQAEKAIGIIDAALEIWDADGNLCDVAKNFKALDHGADLLAKASAEPKIQNLAAQVRDPRLRLYLEKLQHRLLSIVVRYNPGCQPMPRNKLFGIMARSWYWQQQKPRPVSSSVIIKEQRLAAREHACKYLFARQMAANLQSLQVQMMLANFDEVFRQVTAALNHVFRSSSPVEAINSHLRLYQQVKKNLSKDFLALLTLYWNMHQFSGGKRKHKSPFQILGIQGPKENWLDFLLAE